MIFISNFIFFFNPCPPNTECRSLHMDPILFGLLLFASSPYQLFGPGHRSTSLAVCPRYNVKYKVSIPVLLYNIKWALSPLTFRYVSNQIKYVYSIYILITGN